MYIHPVSRIILRGRKLKGQSYAETVTVSWVGAEGGSVLSAKLLITLDVAYICIVCTRVRVRTYTLTHKNNNNGAALVASRVHGGNDVIIIS